MGDARRTVVDGGGRPVTVNGLIRWFVWLAAVSMMVACGGVSRSPDVGHIDWGRAAEGRADDRFWDAWAHSQGRALSHDLRGPCIIIGYYGPLELPGSDGQPWNCWAESDPRLRLLIARLGDEALDSSALFGGGLYASTIERSGPSPTRRLARLWAQRAAPNVPGGAESMARAWRTSPAQVATNEPTLWPAGAVGPAEGLVVVLLLLELGDGRQAGRWLEGAPNTPVIELLRAQAAALDTTQPAADRRERLVRAWHGVRMLMPARAHFELAHLALEAGALAEAEAHFAVLTAEAEPAPPVNLPSVMLSYPRLLSTHPPLNTPALKDLAARIETARRGVPPASGPPVLGDR